MPPPVPRPSAEVVAFNVAHQWNPETASRKLGPLLAKTWFADALLPRLSFRAVEEREALGILAEASNAAPEFEPHLRLLLSYLDAAGLAQQDGQVIKPVKAATLTAAATSTPSPDAREAPPSAPRPTTAVATGFSTPTEGVVQFHVSVKVDMKEFAGWAPDRIAAFFAGIAQVLAAKGAVEKESAG